MVTPVAMEPTLGYHPYSTGFLTCSRNPAGGQCLTGSLTGAGATFPYKKDPKDSNIRIAPSFPTPEEMAMATDLFVLCVKMVSVDKLLENK